MRIRYTSRTLSFLSQIRNRSESEYHALNGLLVLLSTEHEIDNETKVLRDFGSGIPTPVYMDEDWWIVYRVELENGKEIMTVISIWYADSPPNTML